MHLRLDCLVLYDNSGSVYLLQVNKNDDEKHCFLEFGFRYLIKKEVRSIVYSKSLFSRLVISNSEKPIIEDMVYQFFPIVFSCNKIINVRKKQLHKLEAIPLSVSFSFFVCFIHTQRSKHMPHKSKVTT